MEFTRPIPPPGESEEAWLAKYDPYEFAARHPTVAVDLVVLSVRDGTLRVPLIRRTEHPDYGAWALPGGFLLEDERADDAARRVLKDKVDVRRRIPLDRFHFFDLPGRDKRTRVLSMGYLGRLTPKDLPQQDGLHRLEAIVDGNKLRDVFGSIVRLGFDHEAIVAAALDHARVAARADLFWPVPMLSRDVFTVPDLAEAREALGLPTTMDALRRRVAAHPRAIREGVPVSRGTGRRPPDGYRLGG